MQKREILKITVSIIILFFIIGIETNSTAKYIANHLFIIGNIKIDREQPRIEIKSIKEHKENHTVTFRIKVKERNITFNIFNTENLIVKIDNSVSSQNNIKLSEVLKEDDGITYDVTINCSEKIDNISLIIKDSIIMDIANQGNQEVEFTYSPQF